MELSRTNLLQTFVHAQRTYPRECCGLIDDQGRVRYCNNVQDELHRSDPKRFPRNAQTAYSLSFDDLQFLNQSFESDVPVRVIYHSHPDAGAYFSEEDREKALFAGEPVYPVSYLVIEVRQGMARGAKLFSFRNGTFECMAEFDQRAQPVHDVRMRPMADNNLLQERHNYDQNNFT